jgi:hypothetical protein
MWQDLQIGCSLYMTEIKPLLVGYLVLQKHEGKITAQQHVKPQADSPPQRQTSLQTKSRISSQVISHLTQARFFGG